MADIKVVLNSKGFTELLTGTEVRDLVYGHAQAIAQKAGPGFEASHFRGNYGGGRIVAMVAAATEEAMRAEAEDMALSQAVNS